MITIYAIRCVSIKHPWPKDLPCPFKVGAFMYEETTSEWTGGQSLETAATPNEATFYASWEEADKVAKKFSREYAANFDTVTFAQKASQ